jgi:hypothetical protein
MRKSLFVLALMFGSVAAMAQVTNTVPWPNNPVVGIGTQLSGGAVNALQIHHNPSIVQTLPAILRLSDGGATTSSDFGALALIADTTATFRTTYSNLAKQFDLVLHENYGDLILADFKNQGGAIRLSTTPNPLTIPIPPPVTPSNDLERMTILSNGNVGIDLPPDSITGLGKPLDQIQIGGGVVPYPGNTYPSPGLTIYGGNRFENMLKPGGGRYPGDWRYIADNHYVDHNDTSSGRSHRFQATSSSEINFAETNGGLLDFTCSPYDVSRGLNDFSKGMTMQIRGSEGLQTWFMDTTSNPYHHLFDIYLPGQLPWPVTRNTNGLSYFHTPVCITSDRGGDALIDFTNFAHVRPDIGDGLTWMLAVNGAAIAKEFFVLDTTWADYVFDPSYKLPPLGEVEQFVEANHHLPGIPSASQIAKTGVPIGRTEAAITKNVEELTLYTFQLSKQNEELSKKNDELAVKFQKLESEFQELKNQSKR